MRIGETKIRPFFEAVMPFNKAKSFAKENMKIEHTQFSTAKMALAVYLQHRNLAMVA